MPARNGASCSRTEGAQAMKTVALEDLHTVGVVGAGTMGRGIAQVFALAGYEVRLFDSAEGISKRALTSIRADLEEGVRRGKVPADSMEAALSRVAASENLVE